VPLFDVLFGRKRLKEASDERLFALSTAQVTLNVELGLKTAGSAAVVFKPLSAGEFVRAENEMAQLLDSVAQSSGSKIERKTDDMGYEWLVVRDPDIEDLVTTVHLIGSELKARGFGPQLLAGAFRFAGGSGVGSTEPPGSGGAGFAGPRPGKALVGVIMGSRSDWETMRHACETLEALEVPFEQQVVSAHRTPDLLFEYAGSAEARGLQVLIAGAGGSAHLPGMAAAKTALPVLGVPVESKTLKGMDSLLSIVQMPAGVPVGTLAIGRAGAVNAALLAAAIVARSDEGVRERLARYRESQTESVLASPDPTE
jgi:5-(carboxyamino)imidazole ribonucleotide mutase